MSADTIKIESLAELGSVVDHLNRQANDDALPLADRQRAAAAHRIIAEKFATNFAQSSASAPMTVEQLSRLPQSARSEFFARGGQVLR